MSVTWKCFDGIQREEISISDVRTKFRFQWNKPGFQWQFDCQMLVYYPRVKRISSVKSLLFHCYFWC